MGTLTTIAGNKDPWPKKLPWLDPKVTVPKHLDNKQQRQLYLLQCPLYDDETDSLDYEYILGYWHTSNEWIDVEHRLISLEGLEVVKYLPII